jgi:hypothetical protein
MRQKLTTKICSVWEHCPVLCDCQTREFNLVRESRDGYAEEVTFGPKSEDE